MLKGDFDEITHVVNTNLPEDASDTAIWRYATENEYSIITNDEDFYLLSMRNGFPPKTILLRTGNQSTRYIASVLAKHRLEIIGFIESKEYGVLEIY